MRPSLFVAAFLAMLALAFAVLLALSVRPGTQEQARLAAGRALAGRLGLSDLALFTEARYTRHPSQADLHSAFQDHPSALEHFPTGSLLPPAAIEIHGHLAGKTGSPD